MCTIIICYYRPQRSCGKVMILHLCVILFGGGGSLSQHVPQVTWPGGVSVPGGLYLGGSLSGGVSVQGGPCSGGSLSRRGSPVRENPPRQRPPVRWRAGGTHPTGMHSCVVILIHYISGQLLNELLNAAIYIKDINLPFLVQVVLCLSFSSFLLLKKNKMRWNTI